MKPARSRLKTLLWVLAELLVFLGVYLGVRAWLQRDMAEGPPPVDELQLIDGQRVKLTDNRDRPLLIYFWASWCGICGLERGSVDSIAHDWPVLTVAMQSGGPQDIRAYLERHGLDWKVVADPDGRLAARFGLRGVPAFFVLDPHGRIVSHESGYTTEAGLRLRLWLAGKGARD
ncbi:MAG TPA: protein disulfide oxidoreductase [Chromatiales bacterium]|nr:protein disulfide oxidoreductase [Chromatiales bacterium]